MPGPKVKKKNRRRRRRRRRRERRSRRRSEWQSPSDGVAVKRVNQAGAVLH